MIIARRFRRTEVIYPLILLIAGIILFPADMLPSPDSFKYLEYSGEMINTPSVDTIVIWRPLFPAMIALSLSVFGKSLVSAYYVVRVFYILNILLMYFVGRRLLNSKAGFYAAVLLLTSYRYNASSCGLSLDIILPFFCILFVLLLFIGIETGEYKYFIFAGAVFAAAVLTKGGTAVVLFPLPVLILIQKIYRKKNIIRGIMILYLAVAVVLSPWFIRIAAGQENIRLLIGPAGAAKTKLAAPGIEKVSGSDAVAMKNEILDSFAYYLSTQFILWPAFIIAFVYNFCLLFKRDRISVILLLSILLFTPIVFVTIKLNLRAGQLLFLYMLLYLLLSRLLDDIPSIVKSLFKRLKILNINGCPMYAGTTLFVVAAALQVFPGNSFADLLLDSNEHYGFTLWTDNIKVTGDLASDSVCQASEWINNNIPPGCRIICETNYGRVFDFYTDNKYDITQMLYVNLLKPEVYQDHPGLAGLGNPLFIWPNKKNDMEIISRNNQLLGVYEQHLFDQFCDADKIEWLVVGERRNFLSLYLEKNPSFTLASSFNKGSIKIYKLQFPLNSVTFPVHYELNVFKYFSMLYQHKPEIYKSKKDIFKTCLGNRVNHSLFFSAIENNDKDAFNENFMLFKKGRIY